MIAEFGTRFDADLAKARLGQAGIESVVMGDPAYAIAPHHVTERVFRIVVRDEIADHARRILTGGVPADAEADALDAAFHQCRFADRPTWIRWATITLVITFVGPIAATATFHFFWIVRGLFP